MVKVLFVCSGNICRSPTAEGVFRALLRREGIDHLVSTDSAGTHDYHLGDPPDPRSQQAARVRGVDIDDLRARKVRREDFEAFDYVLAMDRGHFRQLEALCPPALKHRLRMFMSFAPDFGAAEVPDPYYGDDNGFERVLDMCEAAAAGLLTEIRANIMER